MLNLQNEYIERGINVQTQGVKGDGTPEDLQLMNNIITQAPPKSDIVIPNGNYSFIGGLAPLTDGKNLIGLGKPVLDFSKAPNRTKAIQINGKAQGIYNFVLKGNGYQNTETIGLDITGDSIRTENVEIYDFQTGIDFAHDNTYILEFHRVRVHDTTVCVYADMFSRNSQNAGERIVFHDSGLFNSVWAVYANCNTLDMYFDNCFIDYCNEFFIFGEGTYYFNGTHLENSLTNPQRVWKANVDRFMTVNGGAVVGFTNCLFNLFQMHRIVNADSTLGTVTYNNCRAYFLASDGTHKTCLSEQRVYIDIRSTSNVLYSPYISKNNYPSVVPAASFDKRQVDFSRKVSLDLLNSKIVTTFDTPTTERTFMKVIF